MEQCKPVISPIMPRALVSDREEMTNEETNNMMTTPYREAIGTLMKLSVRTRPDISVAVGTLAMHVQEPRNMNWEAVKRVLRYLQRTINKGLVITAVPDEVFTLQVYSDANWATYVDNLRSRSGKVCQLGGNTIWWNSRKQNAVVPSSYEADYMALFESSKDTVWLRSLLCEFGYCPVSQLSFIHHYNQGSIAFATNDTVRRACKNLLLNRGQVD
jgi:hypothetical protein